MLAKARLILTTVHEALDNASRKADLRVGLERITRRPRDKVKWRIVRNVTGDAGRAWLVAADDEAGRGSIGILAGQPTADAAGTARGAEIASVLCLCAGGTGPSEGDGHGWAAVQARLAVTITG